MAIDRYTFSEVERIRYGRFPVLDTVLYRWARKIEETLFDHFHTELYAGSSVVEEMKFSAFFGSLKSSTLSGPNSSAEPKAKLAASERPSAAVAKKEPTENG